MFGGVDFEVRDASFVCQRCETEFTQQRLWVADPNSDDAGPVMRPWGRTGPPPPHCPPCVAALTAEAEEREEARLRAVRMDVENPVFKARLESAGIFAPKLLRATMKTFDRRNNMNAYKAARSFVEGVMAGDLGDQPWRFFTGPTGTGKTHLIVGMDRALYGLGFKGRVALIVAPLFVDRVQTGYGDKTASALLDSVRSADVVFVDDLGRGRQTDDKASIMNELLCLMEGKPVVISSNFTREGLVARNQEFMTLASRLGPASCWTVEMVDRDHREDDPTVNSKG
jgi:DNA replication protein DnaC